MNVKKYIFLLTLLSLLSCSKENRLVIVDDDRSEVVVRFILKTFELDGSITKAGYPVVENEVKSLWILQFNGTSDDAKLIRSKFIPEVSDLNNISIQLYEGVNQRIEFVANEFADTLFNEVNAPLNTFCYNDFKNLSRSIIKVPAFLKLYPSTRYIQLHGRYIGDIPNRTSEIKLYHNCAKVTLSYTSEDVSAFPYGNRFRVKSVKVCNVPFNMGYIATPSNETVATTDSILNYGPTTGVNTGEGTGEAYLIGDYSGFVTYYVPENIAGVNPLVTAPDLKRLFAPQTATYIEISGEGLNSEGNITEVVSFRLYLGNNNTDNYNVNVSTHYLITANFRGVNINDSRVDIKKVSNIKDWIEVII